MKEKLSDSELFPFQPHDNVDLANDRYRGCQISCQSKPPEGMVHVCFGDFYLRRASLAQRLGELSDVC